MDREQIGRGSQQEQGRRRAALKDVEYEHSDMLNYGLQRMGTEGMKPELCDGKWAKRAK